MMGKINTTTSPISLNATHVALLALSAPLLPMIVKLVTILIYYMEENASPTALLALSSPTILVYPALTAVFLVARLLLVKFVLTTLSSTMDNVSFPVLMVYTQVTRPIVLRINTYASLVRLTAEPALVLRSINVQAALIALIIQATANA
jgi:hypothetical protein